MRSGLAISRAGRVNVRSLPLAKLVWDVCDDGVASGNPHSAHRVGCLLSQPSRWPDAVAAAAPALMHHACQWQGGRASHCLLTAAPSEQRLQRRQRVC